jgi:hypothetical protein
MAAKKWVKKKQMERKQIGRSGWSTPLQGVRLQRMHAAHATTQNPVALSKTAHDYALTTRNG